MKNVITLSVEVPVASFRESRAKDYIASYPVPPPSSVYGMLLSMVGEVNRHRHCGVRLAMAFLSIPEKSVVLSGKLKSRRDASNEKPLSMIHSKRSTRIFNTTK